MNSTKPKQITANSPEGAADNQAAIETQAKLNAELRNFNDQPQQEIADWKELEQEFHLSQNRLAAIRDNWRQFVESF
jgi:hypothetical protein